jgi:D-sedoheptulose 7-phosphate isomerase
MNRAEKLTIRDLGVQEKMPREQTVNSSELLAWIEEEVSESLRIKQAMLQECAEALAAICVALAERLGQGGKLLLFGNGGSAADAQHIAAEFVGRYTCERPAIPAMALTVNTSTLTAVANDYGYSEVFARQVSAFGTKKDAVIGISTSGNSPSVLGGIAAARERGILTIGFTGGTGGQLRGAVDLCLAVPSTATPRIQECHILAGHIVSGYCEHVLVEQAAKSVGRG